MKTTTDSRWKWLALGLAALLVLAAGCWLGSRFISSRHGDTKAVQPVREIAAVDDAVKKLKDTVKEAQDVRNKLPEVIKGAKENVVRDVGRLDDAGAADRWNGLLGRYREDRAAAEGVLPDE
ncbi:hypothetical protein [Cloacibacillus evryensis]|uniref:hypothetical protein n=1 Tax=Cloacibacillus evryensis TaxID=508460 RepID=UPI00241E695B|nr:hypothetical protein [Cloacibacillus evryensis]